MKFLTYGIVALSVLTLSACGSGTTTGALPGASALNASVPLTSKVVVTARKVGGGAIANLEITLRKNSWPGGPLITKGKTGKLGKVTLTGNWSPNETICVGGRYTFGSGYSESRVCQQPFPPAVTLEFR